MEDKVKLIECDDKDEIQCFKDPFLKPHGDISVNTEKVNEDGKIDCENIEK